MKLTKRERDEAALVCAMMASSTTSWLPYIDDNVGSPSFMLAKAQFYSKAIEYRSNLGRYPLCTRRLEEFEYKLIWAEAEAAIRCDEPIAYPEEVP